MLSSRSFAFLRLAANCALDTLHEAGFIHGQIDHENVVFLDGLVSFVSFKYAGEEPTPCKKWRDRMCLEMMFEGFV